MKIRNLSLAMAALAGCASFCSVRAQDNSAQAAARAVMDMMLEPSATNQVSPSVKTMGTNSVTFYHALTSGTNATHSAQPVEKKKSQPAASADKPAKPVKVKPVPVVAEKAPMATPAAATSAAAMSQAKVENPKPVVPAKPNPATAQPATKVAAGGLGLKPITAPPLPISQAKQVELENLLDLYKANRISPVDYQQHRAAILAEPN